jgi:hypothetical protein
MLAERRFQAFVDDLAGHPALPERRADPPPAQPVVGQPAARVAGGEALVVERALRGETVQRLGDVVGGVAGALEGAGQLGA